MAAPDWVSYAGLITGTVGAITGCLAYRQSNKLKALELRLELRKAEADLRIAVQELLSLLEHARTSRYRVAAATGLFKSGALEAWTKAWEEDIAAAHVLEIKLPDAGIDYTAAQYQELESRLVDVHTRATEAAQLKAKYVGYLTADDKERDRLKANMDKLFPPAPH